VEAFKEHPEWLISLKVGNLRKKKGGSNMKTMKKVVVIGAGGQGGPCAAILAKDRDVSEIVLADIDQSLLNKVKNRVKSDKLTIERVDAGSLEELERITEGADAIINLTVPRFNMNIMKAALQNGAQYVDTALDYPFIAQLTEKKPLEIDNEFKKAGLTALVGCGATPGVSNVLIKYVCDKLDKVDAICIRCGGKILKKPKDIISAWDPGWSPVTAITDYAEEPIVFEDGEYKRYPPFSGREEYNFEPFGKVLLSYHLHEEAAMLPRFIGKGVKYVDFKYPVNIQAGSLIQLGFASDKPVDVKGVKVRPVDLLVELVRLPSDSFFTEEETLDTPGDPNSAKMMAIEIKGTRSGGTINHKITYPFAPLLATVEEKRGLYNKFGTLGIYVALPAVIGAKMCVEGDADRGAIGPECLDPINFLKRMADVGAPVKFHETVSRDVAVS